MKLMLLCLLMAVATAKADPQVDQQQIEILETTVKEFKKTMKNADPNRQKKILLKVIDSENELVTLYNKQSISETSGGPSEKKAAYHNKSLIETSTIFRKNYPHAEESDVVGLIEAKALEKENDLSKAEAIYREIIGPGAIGKIVTQNKVSATIALVELLQQKQRYAEIKNALTLHDSDPSYPQHGIFLRHLSDCYANLKEFDSALNTLNQEITLIKTNHLENELTDSIENYASVLSKIIMHHDSSAFEKVDATLPNLIPGSESAYLKRMIITVSVDDQKKLAERLYDHYKANIKTADRIQLMDVIISQLSFSGENFKATFQTAQNFIQDLLNAKPEEIASISTNKMNALKEALGKVEKAGMNYYKSTKDGAPLIYVNSAQLKIETKNEVIRNKIISNLYELYYERKDNARARNTVKQLAQIKGNEALVLRRTLELDQQEWELQFTDPNTKLEPKKPGSIPFDPKSPKIAHLKKWRDNLVVAKKNKGVDRKFTQYNTYELFKACYLTGVLKTADELASLLLTEDSGSEAAIKAMTLMLETYRLGNDRKNQNRLADQILAAKSPDNLTKLAKQIKYENIILQQQELMNQGDHLNAAAKTEELIKLTNDEKNEFVAQSRFLSGISLLESKREEDAIKQFEQVMKSDQANLKSKAQSPLAIARYRIADKSNDLDATIAAGMNLIQIAENNKDADEALKTITNDQGFAKKILFYSWMSANHTKAQEIRGLICGKNTKYPSLSEDCASIAQSEEAKKKFDECTNIQNTIAAASKIDPLYLIPLSKSVKNCVNGQIGKKVATMSTMKISLLDDSITKAAAAIKSIDDTSAKLKDYFDASLYPEALIASAKMNLDLADKIESFKMKGITGADLDALKAQQKQLADPFRLSAKSKIKAAFDAASDRLTGASQMNKILEWMSKIDSESRQALTQDWKPVKPITSMSEAWKKSEKDLPADSIQIISSNNLKWMTYQFLIRQAGNQKDDTFQAGTLAIGATAYAMAGLETKAMESLDESFSKPIVKGWIGPYLETAYSSLNQIKTKSACEVLAHDEPDSITGLCNGVR